MKLVNELLRFISENGKKPPKIVQIMKVAITSNLCFCFPRSLSPSARKGISIRKIAYAVGYHQIPEVRGMKEVSIKRKLKEDG